MGNRALVLSGGGAKGAFELGVVDYLVKDLQLAFEVICGVSTGALNASFLSQGKGYEGLKERLDELEEIWFGISSDEDVYLKDLSWDSLRIVSLYDNTPLKEKIEDMLNTEAIKDSGVEFRAGVVSLNTGEYITVDQDHASLKRFILASTAIPVLFSPVRYRGRLYVDGGVRNITPLQDAFSALKALPPRESPDELYIVLASPLKVGRCRSSETDNIIEILKRSVEILTAEVYREDISHALEVNEYIRKIEGLRERLKEFVESPILDELFDAVEFPFMVKNQRYVNVTLFEPDREHLGSLEFDPVKIRRAFNAGRAKAREVMSGP